MSNPMLVHLAFMWRGKIAEKRKAPWAMPEAQKIAPMHGILWTPSWPTSVQILPNLSERCIATLQFDWSGI